MEVRAIAKFVRVQPRKVRIIADEIRGKNALHASHLLRYHPSKSARLLNKVLLSAVANAEQNNGLSQELLKISRIEINEGPRLKRITQKAMGRGARIVKKTSHITVVVEDAPAETRVKPHGTKAKARPTLAAPGGKGKGKKPAKEAAAEAAAVEEVVEATPVEASEGAEETGSAEPIAESSETSTEAEGAEAEAGEEKGAE